MKKYKQIFHKALNYLSFSADVDEDILSLMHASVDSGFNSPVDIIEIMKAPEEYFQDIITTALAIQNMKNASCLDASAEVYAFEYTAQELKVHLEHIVPNGAKELSSTIESINEAEYYTKLYAQYGPQLELIFAGQNPQILCLNDEVKFDKTIAKAA